MNYWSDLFTPETFEAFGRSDRTISGFRESQRAMADKVRVGEWNHRGTEGRKDP